MNINPSLLLGKLYETWAKEPAMRIQKLPSSGSAREYYRIFGTKKTVIGAYHTNFKENETFIYFTNFFLQKGVRVPEVYAHNLLENVYLLQDLGDTTLLKHVQEVRNEQNGIFSSELIEIYQYVLEKLAYLQIEGGKGLNYDKCYSKSSFDKQSILWDLNYFKYYFLKLLNISFDEQALETDFHTFANYLLQAPNHYFLFRDFQARNIMLHENDIYFIDYQGGRQGALQYDLASLLYQSKANIPQQIREELVAYYLKSVQSYVEIEEAAFHTYFHAYLLIRLIQVLGAYGFRGLLQRKTHFLSSIPFALNNLKWWIENKQLPIEIPTLLTVLQSLTDKKIQQKFEPTVFDKTTLTVTIQSFSYKQGIPQDDSGHGGGFVFDCRAIHNPGRYQPYKKLTGRDASVISFLETKSNIHTFLSNVYQLVDKSVETYLQRNFSNLMVSFGCTGGQHRSVYSADKLAIYLQKKYPNIKIRLQHIEQERKNWQN